MAQQLVTHLFRLSSILPQTSKHQTIDLLKSYYLMKCKEITKDDLPVKYFSPDVRCPHCYMEWRKSTDVKIVPIKLSKKQRKRIRSLKVSKNWTTERVQNKRNLLNSNEMIQICSFCKHSYAKPMLKPERLRTKERKIKRNKLKGNTSTTVPNQFNPNKNYNKNEDDINKKTVDIYCSAKEIFSLTNKNNTLPNSVKEPKKNKKNNKKKKDKFAGLCEKAVLMSARLQKEENKTKNKLSLFLKSSI